MERPYVVSAELQAVNEVLDVLAETGDCNSVILEGEPGTGKTQWAYSKVGQELQEGKDVTLIHVRVKDTMRAQDLLYSIDDVRRLSDAQAHAQTPEQIRVEAAAWKEKILSGKVNPNEDREYATFRTKMSAVTELGETAKDLDYINYVDLGPLGEAIFQSGKGKRVYLVIDEIEKGREELMTGILDEIENLTFTIGETGTVVKGDKKNLRIVITTNTEDSDKIPPSFRRRSLYHYVEYPTRADMAQIVTLNFPGIQDNLLQYALNVFYTYHDNSEVQKKPSTPELLAWIQVLTKEFDGNIPDSIPHKEVFLKYKEDRDLAIDVTAAKEQNPRVNIERVKSLVSIGYEAIYLDDQYLAEKFRGVDNIFNISATDNGRLIGPGIENLGEGYYCFHDPKIFTFLKEDLNIVFSKVESPGIDAGNLDSWAVTFAEDMGNGFLREERTDNESGQSRTVITEEGKGIVLIYRTV